MVKNVTTKYFIENVYDLKKVDDNGELIFIVPSDFFKLTHASKLISEMVNEGHFTHVDHPNNENLLGAITETTPIACGTEKLK